MTDPISSLFRLQQPRHLPPPPLLRSLLLDCCAPTEAGQLPGYTPSLNFRLTSLGQGLGAQLLLLFTSSSSSDGGGSAAGR